MSSPARHFGPKKRFQVRWEAKGYVVFDPMGLPLTAPNTNHGQALTAAEAFERQAAAKEQRRERPCMCCTTTFHSEGIHNRLCDACSKRGSAEQSPFGTTRSKRRG